MKQSRFGHGESLLNHFCDCLQYLQELNREELFQIVDGCITMTPTYDMFKTSVLQRFFTLL